MKPITVREAIKWLRKQPANTEYHYTNVDGGCLFTRMLSDIRKLPIDNPIQVGGKINVNPGSGFLGTEYAKMTVVPFHDMFWLKALNVTCFSECFMCTVTKRQALQTLRTLL